MEENRSNAVSDGAGRRLHWWHLGALFVLIALVESGRELLRGMPIGEVFSSLSHSLYAWSPILAGVAISIRRSDHHTSRAAAQTGLAITLLMLVLDLAGGLAPPPPEFTTAVGPEGNLQTRTTTTSGRSWAVTGLRWVQGELQGIDQRLPGGAASYPGPHPRTVAAEALYDGSFVLLVFGILGLVLGAGRWIRNHATFGRPEDERAAHLVVAWLLCPLALGIVTSAGQRFFHAALFRDGALWTIPLPALLLLVAGVSAWIHTTRTPANDRRNSADA